MKKRSIRFSQDGPIQVAQYVRMSTEHQQYSIDNQSDAIRHYARAHGMTIVKTYCDSGKSGLTIQKRPALQQLIEDVENGSPRFSAILVYDISRWGRFQDTDESAYYEYRCRRANIAVHYCVEAFTNDGSPWEALLKTMKRTMAAEYSRELSAKVFAGKARLIQLGFRQGGPVGYGYRRLLVDENGKSKHVLKRGEEKSIATDRVVLIPGPPEEIEVVNEVFRLYALEKWATTKIAKSLNERGIRCVDGHRWTRYVVRNMVTNPKYIGTNVMNRQSGKLGSRRVSNPPAMWIRKDQAFPGIIDLNLFQKALAEAESRSASLSDQELLNRLRHFIKRQGKVSERLLRDSPGMPCAQVYAQRFGGLGEAYRRVGYKPYRNLSWVERDRPLVKIRREFIMRVVDMLQEFGASVQQDVRRQFLTINESLNVRLSLARCRARSRINSWRFALVSPYKPDVTVFARLAPGNETILDYCCVPSTKKNLSQLTVSSQTPATRGLEQFKDLKFLKDFAEWGKKLKRGRTSSITNVV